MEVREVPFAVVQKITVDREVISAFAGYFQNGNAIETENLCVRMREQNGRMGGDDELGNPESTELSEEL